MKKIVIIMSSLLTLGTISSSVKNCFVCEEVRNFSKTVIKEFANLRTDKSGFLVFDAQGNLYSSTKNSNIYQITPNGDNSIFADLGTDKSFFLAFDAQGNLYCSTYNSGKIYKIDSNGDNSIFTDLGNDISTHNYLVFDIQGNLYCSSEDSGKIYQIVVAN